MIPAETPIWLAIVLAGGATSVMVLLRYFLSSGLFAWATRRARPGLYSGLGKQIAREIRYSLFSAVIRLRPNRE